MSIPVRNNLDLGKNQLLNALLQQIAGNHGSPEPGLIWYDSNAGVVKFANSAGVQTLGVAGSGGDADTLDGQDSLFYLDRANHTGTQAHDTISDFDTAVNALIAGLASTTYVDNSIAGLVDTAPGTLDTLNEIAAALGDDPNFATTITNQIATKTGKYAQNIGDGVATQIDVVHNLNSRDVVATVRQSASPWAQVFTDVEMFDANTVRVRFSTPPAAGQYRVICIG